MSRTGKVSTSPTRVWLKLPGSSSVPLICLSMPTRKPTSPVSMRTQALSSVTPSTSPTRISLFISHS
jgi:hypothetical protein